MPKRYAENIDVFQFVVIPQRTTCNGFGKFVLSVLGDVHNVFYFVGNVNDSVNVVLSVGKFRSGGKRNRKIVCKIDLDVGVEPQKRIQRYKSGFANRVSVIHLRSVFYRDGNANFEIFYLYFAAEFYLESKDRSRYIDFYFRLLKFKACYCRNNRRFFLFGESVCIVCYRRRLRDGVSDCLFKRDNTFVLFHVFRNHCRRKIYHTFKLRLFFSVYIYIVINVVYVRSNNV